MRPTFSKIEIPSVRVTKVSAPETATPSSPKEKVREATAQTTTTEP